MKKLYCIACIITLLTYTVPKTVSIDTQITQPPVTTDTDKILYDWSRTFAEVLQLANTKHYKIGNLEEAMIKAIDGFLTNLDPHSSFLDPKTYKSMMESTSGEFYGIGIVIDNTRKSKDKFLTIVDTIPSGPSDKVGIKPLDKIIEIDNKPLEGMTTEEATAKLKGERNSKVSIKVLRENHPDLLSFTITRDVIRDQNSLSFHIQPHNMYYVSLNTFSINAVKQIEQLLHHAHKKPYKGLILDLRNNSGGLLHSAIDIAGMFLEKNSLVVVTKDKHNKEIERYATKRDPIVSHDLIIVVLINNYTASAAEILAKVLQENSMQVPNVKNEKNKKPLVLLVGTKSFGKGSVQEVIPISNNCAAKITTSLYFPNNKNIQGEGIKPDFVVDRTLPPTEQMQWFTKYYGREQALTNAIQTTEPKNKKGKKTTTQAAPQKPTRWAERAKEMLQTDNQLREAISLINMLHTFQQICPEKVCNRQLAVTFLKQNHISHEKLEIEEVKL